MSVPPLPRSEKGHFLKAYTSGLNTTDLMCLSFLTDAEPLTAGQLAEATGLTTGSVTIMIDRLEKAGYAIAMPILYMQHRVAPIVLAAAMIDALLGLSFVIAYLRTPGVRDDRAVSTAGA